MSIFPLWWSSFSETLGRRTIYIVSFALFLLWNILAAVSTNIAMLIVTRLLGGGAAASVQAVGAGTIADIWEVKERGRAMGIFYLGPLMGPLFAPIIGGVLGEKLGWRSTQWALAIYGGFLLVVLFFALPETLKDRRPALEEPTGEAQAVPPPLKRTSSRRVVHQKTKTTVKWLKRAFLDPLKIILYLRFPAVAITVYYAAITFGSLYLLNISLETTFAKPPYDFSTIEVGLTYIPNSIGYLLASLFGGRWTDKIMARAAVKAKRYDEKGKLIYRPEDRMGINAWIAAVLYPGALIWYGWTAEKGVIWPVPVSSSNPSCTSLAFHPHCTFALLATHYVIVNHAANFPFTVNSQLLLRRRLHADLRNGHHNAHGIHAPPRLLRRRSQQFRPEYLFLCRCYRRRPTYQSYWRWMAVHWRWCYSFV